MGYIIAGIIMYSIGCILEWIGDIFRKWTTPGKVSGSNLHIAMLIFVEFKAYLLIMILLKNMLQL